MTTLIERFVGQRVDPTQQEVVKFFPTEPPRRGTVILVDGIRSRVSYSRIKWDGPRWTIQSLRAKPAPPSGPEGGADVGSR